MSYIIVYAFKPCCGDLPDMVRQREKLTVTVPQDLIDWLDEMVRERTFANRSHGTELCIRAMREAQERRPKK